MTVSNISHHMMKSRSVSIITMVACSFVRGGPGVSLTEDIVTPPRVTSARVWLKVC